MFKELWWLIKLLFKKVKGDEILIVKYMKYFPFKGYSAMSWCGYLIIRLKTVINPTTKNHENIHLKLCICKYKGKMWVRFYIYYLWEYLKGTPLFGHKAAYYTIPYEMEACTHLNNSNYLNYVTKDSYKRYKIKHRRKTFNKYKNNWISYLKTF